MEGGFVWFASVARCFVWRASSLPHQFSFKCTPEEFAELTQNPGIIPAPYVARYHWVLIEEDDALRWKEIERLIRDSHQMVYEKLPKKVKDGLDGKKSTGKSAARK